MVKIYVKQIKNGVINPATGKAWCLEDVPIRWREEVRKALEEE